MVCPGFVRTEVSINALKGDGSKHGRMDDAQAKGMSAERCAAKTLNAIARGRAEVMIGGIEVMAVYAKRLLPSLYSKVIRRVKAV